MICITHTHHFDLTSYHTSPFISLLQPHGKNTFSLFFQQSKPIPASGPLYLLFSTQTVLPSATGMAVFFSSFRPLLQCHLIRAELSLIILFNTTLFYHSIPLLSCFFLPSQHIPPPNLCYIFMIIFLGLFPLEHNFSSLLYHQCLQYCPEHSRHSINSNYI